MNSRHVWQKDDRGVSLVELAVYIVVLGLLSTLLASTMLSLFRGEETVSNVTQASNNAQNFMSVFDKDVRNSQSAYCGNPATGPVACPASAVTLETLSKRGQTVCFSPVVWEFVGGNVTRTESGDTTFVLPADSGTFAPNARTVSFDFKSVASGAGSQTFHGSTAFAPGLGGVGQC